MGPEDRPQARGWAMFSPHLSRRASNGGPAGRGPRQGPAAPGLTGNGDMEVIRVMLIIVLSLSYFYNFFLGLEFTYMIPQTTCVIFMAVFLTFFTGVLLLSALLLYHIKLRQGKSVYYSNYHITWNISTAYISIFFHFASGLFSLLEYQRVMKKSASVTTMENSGRDSDMRQQSGSSIQVIPLPERSPILPSIVHTHSDPSKESRLQRDSQMQKRRVTWAM
ncbi:transmembrane protein 225 [Myotis myotis]|uniref:Transmembrane protein 225 n=1 Tax=Myotis myotis TaxID=51298 RepID=A0A7J7S3K4_MYOMY|nr:transmembrane protein 225 [Myotis myotis]KAF6282928.1 transmembrane protein 225 [Myotis myotis]